jgi:uncharacterized OB-fold protein
LIPFSAVVAAEEENMALIQCKDCGHSVSNTAPTCPNCGRPITAKNMGACGWIIVIALGIVAAIVILSLG